MKDNPPPPKRGRPRKEVTMDDAPSKDTVRIHLTPTADPEPVADPAFGDKTPAVIEWRRRNWTESKFNQVYPAWRKLPI